jgi:hypothetical protein
VYLSSSMKLTSGNLQGVSHNLGSFSRRPVDGLQIFHRSGCKPRDFDDLALASAMIRRSILRIEKLTGIRITHFMLNDELFAHIVEVSFAHSSETIPDILFNKFNFSLGQRWELSGIKRAIR